MNIYYYHNSKVIGYFIDKNNKMHIFTNREIISVDESCKSEDWIRNNIPYYSREDLRNLADWTNIKKKFFNAAKTVEEEPVQIVEEYLSVLDVVDEEPTQAVEESTMETAYYWPLGEIELEEVNL